MLSEELRKYVDRQGNFTPEGARKFMDDNRRAIRFDDANAPHMGRGEMLTIRGDRLLIRPYGAHNREIAILISRCRPWTGGEEQLKQIHPGRPNTVLGDLDSQTRAVIHQIVTSPKLAAAVKATTPSSGLNHKQEPFQLPETPPKAPATTPVPAAGVVRAVPQAPQTGSDTLQTVSVAPVASADSPVKMTEEAVKWCVLDRVTLELWHGGRNGDRDFEFKSGLEEASWFDLTASAHRAMEHLARLHPRRELYVVTRERAMDLLTAPSPTKPVQVADATSEVVSLDRIKADMRKADEAVAHATAAVTTAQQGLATANKQRDAVKAHYAPLLQEIMKAMGL